MHTRSNRPAPGRQPRAPRRPLSFTGCALACLAAAAPAAAQPNAAQQDAPVLEAVVVTASAREQKIREAPASISVITREQLDQQPFVNLQDAVRTLEGVSIVGGGPNDKDISIRGLPGEYTLILVDGKRQSTRETMNRGTGGVQSNLIPPLEAIERIEVVRGPMSSLYGSDAIGGVINIITRKVPQTWGGSLSLGAVVPQESDEGDTRQAGFWLGGPIKTDTVGLQIYGKLTDRDEDRIYYPGPLTSGTFGSTDRNLTAKLSLTPSREHAFTVEAGHSEFSQERRPGRSIAATSAALKTEHERRHWAVTHEGRWQFGNSALALYQEVGKQRNWTNGTRSTVTPEVTDTVLDGQVSLPFTRHLLKLGAQYSHAEVDGIGRQDSIPGYPVNIDSVSVKSWALFAEDDFFVTERLTLTGGLRLDDHENYGSHWTPRLYAVYKLSDTLTLRGGAAKGFKAPTIRQSAAGYCMTTGGQTGNVSPPGTLCGNPDLKPETSVTEEIGIRYDSPRGASVSATLFNNDFKNKVASYDTGVADPLVPSRNIYVYDNIDKVTLRGIELAAAWPLARAWRVSGNYTYTDSERKGGGEPAFDGGSLDGRPLDKTPEHVLNAQLDWTPSEALALYARMTYLGKQYWAAFRNGAMNVREREGSTTFDLGGSYQLRRNLALKFALLNVTDRKVAVDERTRTTGLAGNWMVDEGRRLWVGMEASF
jgi:outer membrane receptor for ferrienterochelin and colicins